MIIYYSLISVSLFVIIFILLYFVVKNKKAIKTIPLPVKTEKVYEIKNNRVDEAAIIIEEHPKRTDSKGKERRYYGDKVLYGKDAQNMEKKALKAYLHGDFYFFYKDKRFRTPEIFF